MRQHLGRWGQRGASVTVFVERGAVWLRFSVRGRSLKRFGDDTGPVRRKAMAWAKKYGAARTAAREQMAPSGKGLTLRGLWLKYEKANSEAWRPKTTKGYRDYLGNLEEYFGPGFKVGKLTLDDVDEYRISQRAATVAHGQVRRQIGFLRQLLNWAEGRDLIARNKLHAYRYVIGKDERDTQPDEYSRSDVLAIAEQLAGPRHWRPRSIITLCGSLGARINAVLHLQWADVDLDEGLVTWRAAHDKLGEEGTQPLTPMAKAALVEAWGQRHETEPWVFWAVRSGVAGEGRRAHRSTAGEPKGRPYHYNSVLHHLNEAEKRAGVEHRHGRAFHGLRRMVVGDLGDLALAASWVRQKSLKVTAGYDRQRKAQQHEAAAKMARLEAPPERHQQREGA